MEWPSEFKQRRCQPHEAMLGQVLPVPPMDDQSHHSLADPIFAGELSRRNAARCVALAQRDHLLVCQFGVRVLLTAQQVLRMQPGTVLVSASRAAFGRAVTGIVKIGAQKEMRWVTARRVVTSMEDIETRWDGTVLKLPSNPMRSLVPATNSQYAVTLATTTACPGPTTVRVAGLSDMFPEMGLCAPLSLKDSCTRMATRHGLGTSAGNLGGLPVKKAATNRASQKGYSRSRMGPHGEPPFAVPGPRAFHCRGGPIVPSIISKEGRVDHH